MLLSKRLEFSALVSLRDCSCCNFSRRCCAAITQQMVSSIFHQTYFNNRYTPGDSKLITPSSRSSCRTRLMVCAGVEPMEPTSSVTRFNSSSISSWRVKTSVPFRFERRMMEASTLLFQSTAERDQPLDPRSTLPQIGRAE